MKLSFNKSSKSIITSYTNKTNFYQFPKEIKYSYSTKNFSKERINLNYNNKRNINIIMPLKNNSFFKQSQTLFLQFHNNKIKRNHSINNFNSNNTNTKFSTTSLTEKKYLKKKKSNKKLFQSLNTLSFKEKKIIKETTLNIIKKSKSEENNLDKINKRRSSATLAYLFYKENHPIKKNKLSYRRINYPLNELMKLDPYHYLPKGIKDSINKFKIINKKFNYPNLKNVLKTSNGNSVKSLFSNTILLRKNNNNKKIHLFKKLLKIYENIPYDDLKYCIKWEGINHIWQKHIKLINFLLKNYNSYKWFFNENEYLNYEKLKDFFKICLQVNSFDVNCNCFVDDIFLLFSNDKIYTNIKKLFCTLIITNNSISYEDKINSLIEVWLNESNNCININDMYFYIKNNLRTKSDHKKIVSFFKNIIKTKKYNSRIFNKEDIYKYYIENIELRKIFEKNCNLNYKKIEEEYNEAVTKYYSINSNEFNYGVNNQNVRFFSPILIRRLNDLIEGIDRNNEKKEKINDLLDNENYNSN